MVASPAPLRPTSHQLKQLRAVVSCHIYFTPFSSLIPSSSPQFLPCVCGNTAIDGGGVGCKCAEPRNRSHPPSLELSEALVQKGSFYFRRVRVSTQVLLSELAMKVLKVILMLFSITVAQWVKNAFLCSDFTTCVHCVFAIESRSLSSQAEQHVLGQPHIMYVDCCIGPF